jgi:hypothetical protein
MPRCAGNKDDGSPCERIVKASQRYCYSHDPERAEERKRNASRGGRSKGIEIERKIREQEELEARLEALEDVLKRRAG